MSTLTAPAASEPRMSQVLPSVKCSDCAQPVPLLELGEHRCAPMPPVPTLPPKSRTPAPAPVPAPAPKPAARAISPPARAPSLAPPRKAQNPDDLLPARLKGLVGQPSRVADRTPSPGPAPPRQPSPAPSTSSRYTSSSYRSSQETINTRPLAPPIQTDIRTRSPSIASHSSSSGRSTYQPLAPPSQNDTRQRPPSVASYQSSRSDRSVASSVARQPPPPALAPPPAPAPAPRVPELVDPRELYSPEDEIATHIGGEAGMAGVGRRGFAAAARAAMFAAVHKSPTSPLPSQSFENRRNAPPSLDIRSRGSARTPPLSPHSGSQSSYSPISPHSPADFGAPSQPIRKPAAVPKSTPFIPRGRDELMTPISPPTATLFSPVERDDAPPISALEPSTPRLAFFDKFKAAMGGGQPEPPRSPSPPARTPVASSPNHKRMPSNMSHSTDSEDGGLAYARSSEDRSRSSQETDRIQFPSSDSPPRMPRGNTGGGGAATVRSLSSASAYSSKSGHNARENLVLRLDAVSEVDDRDTRSVVSSSSSGGPGRKAASAVDHSAEKLRAPMRALTSPTSPRGDREKKSVQRRAKTCVRCEQTIPNGRYIQTDGPGVLCEKCWKTMYLPRCRRCDKIIEGPAISSADGQLKGKYHKECFTCFTCDKPFPDKSFYVYDGQPYCSYHYHEANNSLCAATLCGDPIEGPCAVSHAGDRYHPEHLTCEYEYRGSYDGVRTRRCDEVLRDYWEVEGRMLCERHARAVEREDDDDGLRPSKKAMKRQTRLINIAGLPQH